MREKEVDVIVVDGEGNSRRAYISEKAINHYERLPFGASFRLPLKVVDTGDLPPGEEIHIKDILVPYDPDRWNMWRSKS